MLNSGSPPTVDERLAAIAERQWGLLKLEQLLQHLSMSAISRRVRSGRLHRLHPGVYSLVPREALADEGRWLAAVFAGGEHAALSHRSAACLWSVLDKDLPYPDITVPRGRARRVARVLLHRSRSFPLDDSLTLRGIPVTPLDRTIADLAEVLPRSRCGIPRSRRSS